MRRKLVRSTSTFLAACLVPALGVGLGMGLSSVAFADDPPDVPETPTPEGLDEAEWELETDPLIHLGQPVNTCGWPTAVAVTGGGSLCTGTLIDPQLVVYAAHCGGGGKKIKFGESSATAAKTITPEFCSTFAGYSSQRNDWAFCKLYEPIDLPTTPAVFGCENSALQANAEIAIVGFGGNTPQGGSGTKRWAMTRINGVNFQQNIVGLGGGQNPSVCPGDSGGPAMIQYPDGSWHAFGIASTVTGGCGGSGTHSLISGAIPWIETESGLDVTPCFDQDGTWNPTPKCQNFYAGPESADGTGTWTDWCPGTPAIGSSDTCGDPFDAIPDTDPPTVVITAPNDGDEIDPGDKITVSIDAQDVGWGIREVGIVINGEVQDIVDTEPPYEFNNVSFPEGQYTIVATATDWADQTAESEPVGIGVGDDPPPLPEDDTGEGEEGEGEEAGDEGLDTSSEDSGTGGETTGGLDDTSEGCNCNAPGDRPSGLAWSVLCLAGLAGWSRRRNR